MENTASFKLLEEGYEGVALTKMFPAKGFYPSASGGAWYAAKLLDEQQRLGQQSREKGGDHVRSYSRLKKQRKREAKLQRLYEKGEEIPEETQSQLDERETHLDGFFLLRVHGVSDPSDLSALDISGRPLETANDEDMELFENVIYINAAETLLPFETFNHFPSLRELETPLCALRSIRVNMNDFDSLELLDLSYNNLSPEDVGSLSILPKLKALYLTGNQLTHLPESLCSNVIFKSDESESASANGVEMEAFPNLEVLHLDDNCFHDAQTLAILAGLRRLKYLSLDNNSIPSIPYIKIKRGKPIERVHVNAIEFNLEDNDDEINDVMSNAKSENILDDLNDVDNGEVVNEGSLSDAKLTNSLSVVDPANPVASDSTVIDDKTNPVGIEPTPVGESVSNEGGTVVPVNSLVNPQGEESRSEDSNGSQQVPPAFEELRILSIAYNQIGSEDGVLPVVGWPMLQEVNIAGNPLVAKHNGEPPLLNRYLTNRLGITLKRFDLPQKSRVPQGPVVENPTALPPPHRKIPEVVPPKKRQPIDFMALEYPGVFDPLPSKENTLEMIEARKQHIVKQFVCPPALPDQEAVAIPLRSMSANQNAPLPPIGANLSGDGEGVRPQSGPDNMQHMRFAPTEMDRLPTENVLVHRGPPKPTKFAPIPDLQEEEESAHSGHRSADRTEETTAGGGSAAVDDQEPFFLTQVDDQEGDTTTNAGKSENPATMSKVSDGKSRYMSKATTSKPKKGPYGLLYQTDEDEEKFSLNLPKDVQSNVKALKYALKHPVSFSDTPVSHERVMHLYQPDKFKRPSKPKMVHQSKTELFYDTLSDLKNRVAYVETNLEKALVDTDRHKVEQVHSLVAEIQSNYKKSAGTKSVKL